MAILRSDGFDIYGSITEVIQSGWYRESATQNGFSTTLGRFGGGCLQGALTSGSNGWYTSVNLASDAALYVAFAYRHDGATTTDTLFQVQNFAEQLAGRVTVAASGTLQSQNRSGTVVETTVGTPLTPGSWHWVEIKFISGSGAANGEISVRVDESLVLTLTNLDTRPVGTAQTVGALKFSGPRGAGGVDVRIDDLFVMDTSGAVFNGFMADRRIQTVIPTGDAATVNWTASSSTDVSCVDDALGAANDDTDFISSSTVAQESRFAMGNLPVSPLSVDAVVVKYRAKKTDAGTRTLRGLINSNGSESVGTTRALSTDYVWQTTNPFLTNPDGSVAWTEASVNALEAGVEIVA